MKRFAIVFVFAIVISCVLLIAAPSWIDGEMGYRVSAIPEASPAARHGLSIGDILAEPALLPNRLADAGVEGVEIPIYRLNMSRATYGKTTMRLTFLPGEERRLGTTGDIGFIVTAVRSGSLGARAELQPGDFIAKIDQTFVHSENDLKLVDDAYEKGNEVLISFTRWFPESNAFKSLASRRRFVK